MAKHRPKNPRIKFVSPHTGKKNISWLDKKGNIIRKDENLPLIVIPNELQNAIVYKPVASAPETSESDQNLFNQEKYEAGGFSAINFDDQMDAFDDFQYDYDDIF